jgi:ABC-type uncharacterized transport system substrate-binding protein
MILSKCSPRCRVNALMPSRVSDVLTFLKRFVEFAAANQLPTIFENSEMVREGGLMAYSPNQSAISERLADFVAHILQGARAVDLPLEMFCKICCRFLKLDLGPLQWLTAGSDRPCLRQRLN